jgi:hypothetical protein
VSVRRRVASVCTTCLAPTKGVFVIRSTHARGIINHGWRGTKRRLLYCTTKLRVFTVRPLCAFYRVEEGNVASRSFPGAGGPNGSYWGQRSGGVVSCRLLSPLGENNVKRQQYCTNRGGCGSHPGDATQNPPPPCHSARPPASPQAKIQSSCGWLWAVNIDCAWGKSKTPSHVWSSDWYNKCPKI